MSLRTGFEWAFERWARIVCKQRWVVIVTLVTFALALGSQIGRIEVDTSFEGYLPAHDSTLVTYAKFREQFGTEERVVIAIKPQNVFDLRFLNWLKALHEDLETSVPHVREVTSLINARHTYGTGDALVVEDLLTNFPTNTEELQHFETLVRQNPLYQNVLISKDAKFTTIVLKIETDAQKESDAEVLDAFEGASARATAKGSSKKSEVHVLNSRQLKEFVQSLQKTVDRHRASEIEMYVAGGLVMNYEMTSILNHDMALFGVVGNLVILGLLFVSFRGHWRGVVLPMTVVTLAILSTAGIMALLKIPLTGTTLILPSFLLAACIGDSVHILEIYFCGIEEGKTREEAIRYALSHASLAVFMTSATTAGSLASFLTADLRPVADLGIVSPIGVILGFVYSVALLPALLAVLPVGKIRVHAPDAAPPLLDRALIACGEIGAKKPWWVVTVSALLCLIAAHGVSKLRFSHDVLPWFPDDMPIAQAYRVVNRDMQGLYSAEFLVQTDRENGVQDPRLLKAMDQMGEYAANLKLGNVVTGKVISIVDIVKETHQALNENRPEYYRVPEDPNVIAQELLLFENSGTDDLTEVVDTQFQVGRISLLVPAVDAFGYPPYVDALTKKFQELAGANVRIVATGLVTLMARTFHAVVTSMASSYLVSFAVIALLMSLMAGTVRGGLVVMIPNMLPIFLTMGYMGWAGITLNFATILLGGIAIGIAVDDTIHFVHNWRHYYVTHRNAELAVRETMQTTGRAMFLTTAVLATSFFVYTLSKMKNMDFFGSLNGMAIILALLADLLLSPALVVLMARSKWFATALGKN